MLKRKSMAFALSLVSVGALPGCFAQNYDRDLVAAFELGREDRWGEAKEYARQYLLHHPEQAVGHYVWGQCNAHPDPQYAIAEGEFKMAQSLFARDKDLGPLEGLLTPDEFASALHRELAILNMRWGYEAMELGAIPRRAVRERFVRAFENARAGLALHPESKYLGELVEMLRGVLVGPDVQVRR